MSVTIKQSPQLLMPVGNPIVFTVDSTNKANCNFQYIADVYVNGVYATRLRLFPSGPLGYASFKFNRILTDFISFDIHANLYGTANNPNSIVYYSIKFGEEYDTSVACNAGVTSFPNLTTTSDFYAFNGALQYKEWHDYNYSEYSTNSNTKKFLTKMPNNAMVGFDDQLNLNFFNLATNQIPFIEVKTYNSNNSLTGTFQFANSQFTLGTNADRLVSIGIGPDNLNNTTLTLGAQPVIDITTAYYTVKLVDAFTNPISETKSFQIDTRVTKWEGKRLWFLNRLGAFDAYTYSLVDTRTLSVSNTQYNKLMGSYRALSPTSTWTYDIGDRGRSVMNVQAQESMTFNSNWLTEPEALWMEELFTTPELYLSLKKDCITTTTLDFNNLNCDFPPDALSGALQFTTISIPAGMNIGSSIYVTFTELGLIDGYYNITNIFLGLDELYYITIEYTCDSSYESTTGTITYTTPINYVNEFTPYVRTSASWAEKIKKNIRNINYNIEVQPAYSVNIQRN